MQSSVVVGAVPVPLGVQCGVTFRVALGWSVVPSVAPGAESDTCWASVGVVAGGTSCIEGAGLDVSAGVIVPVGMSQMPYLEVVQQAVDSVGEELVPCLGGEPVLMSKKSFPNPIWEAGVHVALRRALAMAYDVPEFSVRRLGAW